eukprot:1460076-Lingulodinium_polyedra.AAC.1
MCLSLARPKRWPKDPLHSSLGGKQRCCTVVGGMTKPKQWPKGQLARPRKRRNGQLHVDLFGAT